VRFLLDQDVYALTARFLRELGHDLVTAAELGLARAADTVLLARAVQESRIFVTRDKDFGGLVFVERLGKGVVYLRITPSTVQNHPRAIETRPSNAHRIRPTPCRWGEHPRTPKTAATPAHKRD